MCCTSKTGVKCLVFLLSLFATFTWTFGGETELTFELPDNARQCFYEVIEKGTKSIIEFQVVTGGQYDVDMEIKSPTQQVLYKDVRKQYDTFEWTPETDGVYEACFSNEFSTFTHKLVYVHWQVGEEEALLPDMDVAVSAMTQLQTSLSNIHEQLKLVIDYQTHHRLRESGGRARADDLNSKVLWWSFLESVVILTVGVGQVIVLRQFFTDKRSVHGKPMSNNC